MFKTLSSLAFLLSLLTLVAGCGDKKASEIAQSLNDRRGAQPAPANALFTEGAQYATTCDTAKLQYGDIRFPGIKTTFTMTEAKFTKQNFYYTDNCKTQSMIATESGSSQRLTNSDATPLDVDLSYEKTTVVLQNDLLVSAFNLTNVCGFSDWEIGVEKVIAGEALKGCPVKPAPRAQPVLLLVEGSTLFFGEKIDASSTTKRPTQVDRNLKFVKQ